MKEGSELKLMLKSEHYFLLWGIGGYYGKASIKRVNDDYILSLEYHPSIYGVLSPFNKEQLICTYYHPMFEKVQLPFVIENQQVKSFMLFADRFMYHMVTNSGKKNR